MQPTRLGPVFAFLVAVLCVGQAAAAPDAVIQRVTEDLRHGRDVVVASYVGFWVDYANDPARNIYWGALYGHGRLLERPAEIRNRLPFLLLTRYSLLRTAVFRRDPVAVKVYAAPASLEPATGTDAPAAGIVAPGAGIDSPAARAALPGAGPAAATPGRMIVVTLGYTDMFRAYTDMVAHLKAGTIPAEVARDEELAALLQRAYVIGYWGHNIHYGGADTDDLESAPRTATDAPRGAFVVGCQSARWFPQKCLAEGIEPLLFTTTNMAPEAYVALGLYDALGRGLDAAALRHHVARAYQVYQRLSRPPVGLFINDPEEIRRTAQPLGSARTRMDGP